MKSKTLNFRYGYGVHGVSPLPHYFEEIYGHIQGITKIGPRGDAEYLWYSKDKNGSAYYEVSEQQKSAESTHIFLRDKNNQRKYLHGIEQTIKEVQDWIKFIESLDLKSLNLTHLFKYSRESWVLDAKVFSYYLISQPYRLQLFEDYLRHELQKRVAGSRVDFYLTKLTAPDKMTQTLREELEWSELIIAAKKVAKPNARNTIFKDYPELKKKVLKHYEKYKVLNLGDGNWQLDPGSELKRFMRDLKKPLPYFQAKAKQIKTLPSKAQQEKRRLIDELWLNEKKTIETINFLSEMSHVRYTMRVAGFIPLIYTTTKVIDELALRLGYTKDFDIGFLTYQELLEAERAGHALVSVDTIKKRRGTNDEYMIRLHRGKLSYLYGKEAGKTFQKLVPPINHSSVNELKGVSAYPGNIKATVTVYHWGDNMDKVIKSLVRNPILIAGQTRPTMMSMIRRAKGIVTDEGGVTSHAAIVARELGLPTVINTVTATKMLKTGDKIELDAKNGVIKKLS